MHVLQPSSFSLNFLTATFSHQDPRVVYKKYVSQFMMPNGHHWWAGEFTYMHYAYGHTSLFFIQVIILFYTDIYSDHCRKKSYIFSCNVPASMSKWIIKESMYCLNLTNVNQSLHERIWTDVSLKTIFSQKT